MVDSSFFFTEKRWNYLQKILKKEREMTQTDRHGTVGCVALDKNGNLAAGTSTGGMTNKKFRCHEEYCDQGHTPPKLYESDAKGPYHGELRLPAQGQQDAQGERCDDADTNAFG